MMAGRLGDILVEQGAVSEEQIKTALTAQGSERGMLGTLLVKKGLISLGQLGSALSEQFEVPYKQLAAEDVNPQIVRLIPETFARERQIAPVMVVANQLILAMIAPDDIGAIFEVELITGYKVQPLVTMTQDLMSILDRGFDERVTAQQTVVDIRLAELEEARQNGEVEMITVVEPEDEDAPVVRLVHSILMGAINAGASDIHLEPYDPQMRARYRIDGQLQQVMTIPNHTEDAVVARIKVMADMNTTETRKPQDGNLTIEENGNRASFRVSTIPTVGGEKVVMRVLDETSKTFTFDSLGMLENDVETIKTLIDKPYGMLVVTGPTGSGKTTTMYTMLMNIDASEKNISTIEDPVEFSLPGINQVQADNEHGMGFANGLKYLMRQDPDVILLGEIRDHETAATAVQAALTGHLLISTLHTNDAVGSIARLKDLGLDDFKIGGSLLGAIAQRLLRKICPSCKEPHTPNEKMLKELPLLDGKELPSGAEFFMGRGCRKCMGTGYTGRLPIYEIMVVTSPLEKAIEEGYPGSQLREIAAAEGMVELGTAGLDQALKGNTSIEEVYFKLSS